MLYTYIKENIYPKCKFLPGDTEVVQDICRSSLYPNGNIVLPEGVSADSFVSGYFRKIPKIFTQLRKTSEANVANKMKGTHT